ncbi:MAG TPA: hypothetical protein VFQ00_09545 [Terriglobales bacterium]|nr:hypothetical protein [Terriglobales bacterium]
MADLAKTLLDNPAFEQVPKVISPTAHGVIDYLVVAYYFGIAGACWNSNKRAGIAALANGAAVLGTSMMTDYWGDGRKPISFATHGVIDCFQGAAAALAPLLLGFADEGAASLFWAQAGSEAGVLAMTDFHAADRTEARLEAA